MTAVSSLGLSVTSEDKCKMIIQVAEWQNLIQFQFCI